MSRNRTPRYEFIDAIRGLAASLVMLQHSLYFSGLLGNWPQQTLTGFIPTFLELGETGVVAFFMVSGFVIPLSIEKTADFRLFWIHRFLRIYPLYLVVYGVTLFLQAGGDISGVKAFSFNFLAHLFMVQDYVRQTNYVAGSWTLSIEMVWYIGLSGLFLLGLNRKTYLLVGATVAVSLVAMLVVAQGDHLPMGRLSLLVCCVLGLVCYRFEKQQLSEKTFAALAIILLATIAANLIVGFWIYPAPHREGWHVSVLNSWGLAGLLFFVPFFMRRSIFWSHGILSYLGRISYSIYLIHAVVLIVLKHTALTGVPFLFATFILTIGISSLSYRFIEAPPIRFGHKLKRPSSATPASQPRPDAEKTMSA